MLITCVRDGGLLGAGKDTPESLTTASTGLSKAGFVIIGEVWLVKTVLLEDAVQL
jgi:hypothetical protein